MPRLIVRNIGPIKSVEIELTPVTVFIGPQSSGKSTLSKIISFCFWMEKDAVFRQSISHIDLDFIKEQLLSFHKIENYLNESPYIYYESSVIVFNTDFKSVQINKAGGFRFAKNGKIAYIPSERNIINLPGIQSLPLKRNNIRSFIFDLFRSHSYYTKEAPVDLGFLNAKYYYDDSLKQDIILSSNGKTMLLEESSSGMQSFVPLYVYINYLTDWIFTHESEVSFEDKAILENSIAIKYAEYALEPTDGLNDLSDEFFEDENVKNVVGQLYAKINTIRNKYQGDEKVAPILEPYLAVEELLLKPHYTKIIIEEPEQNLFPETQSQLVKMIFNQIDNNRDSIVITTHSPYVLATLNNLIYAHNVGQNNSKEVEEIIPSQSWVDYYSVKAYYIHQGTLISMNDDELRLLKPEMIDGISSDLNNEFDKLMELE